MAASRVETQSADVTEAIFEMVTISLVIDDNGIAQVAMGVAHIFVHEATQEATCPKSRKQRLTGAVETMSTVG